MNSGPLSERICPGTPRRMKRSESASMTSMDLSLRATRMARHSWVILRQAQDDVVDDVEHADLAPVMGSVLDEVVGPDMIAVLGAKPDAGAIAQPEPAALGLPGRDLQPLASPDALDPLVVDEPTGPAQQLGDLTIAIAAILPGQLDEIGGQ